MYLFESFVFMAEWNLLNFLLTHDKQIPKVCSNYTCLAVILNDFVLKKGENYPQAFLKECKYTEREKEMIRYITDDLEISSDDFYEEQINKYYGVFFEGAILKNFFLGSIFENVFLSEQFWKILKFAAHWDDCWLGWLVIEMATNWDGCWLGQVMIGMAAEWDGYWLRWVLIAVAADCDGCFFIFVLLISI